MRILAGGYQKVEFLKNELSVFIEKSISIDIQLSELVETLEVFSKKVLELELDNDIKNEISNFCSKEEIEKKILCELGSLDAFEIKKRDFKSGPISYEHKYR